MITGELRSKVDSIWLEIFSAGSKASQYKHAHIVFFGGFLPTWARCTLEAIIDDYTPETRLLNEVIDYHTGLWPHGHVELIRCHLSDSSCLKRVMDVYGDFFGVPELGTSSSNPLMVPCGRCWTEN